MTYSTPHFIATDKKMKKENSGPRAETLMLIRYYARIYEFMPEPKSKPGKYLFN